MNNQDKIETLETFETLEINGRLYVAVDSLPPSLPPGNRAVVVLDSGWIFAGDCTECDGRVVMTNVVQVEKWREIGIHGVLADPQSPKVTLRRILTPVEFPAGAEIFRFRVAKDWGIKCTQ